MDDSVSRDSGESWRETRCGKSCCSEELRWVASGEREKLFSLSRRRELMEGSKGERKIDWRRGRRMLWYEEYTQHMPFSALSRLSPFLYIYMNIFILEIWSSRITEGGREKEREWRGGDGRLGTVRVGETMQMQMSPSPGGNGKRMEKVSFSAEGRFIFRPLSCRFQSCGQRYTTHSIFATDTF